jgi:hypothetical protein
LRRVHGKKMRKKKNVGERNRKKRKESLESYFGFA